MGDVMEAGDLNVQTKLTSQQLCDFYLPVRDSRNKSPSTVLHH